MNVLLLLLVLLYELCLGYQGYPRHWMRGNWDLGSLASTTSSETSETILSHDIDGEGQYSAEKEMLHVLHHDGDLNGVAKLFTSALELDLNDDDYVSTSTSIDETVNSNLMNVSHRYLEESYYYNIGLQALLKTRRYELAKTILQRGVIDRGVKFGADTVHIFIRDAFQRGVPEEACDMFDTYFEGSNQPQRSTMTVNMMVEGFRNAGAFDKAREYVECMEDRYNLRADSYTFSSLVRMANTSREIWRLLELTEDTNQTSVPFLRCCVESFGKLGCPGDAIKVYTRYLAGDSRKSGDALLAALLSYRSVGKSPGGKGVACGYIALALAGLLEEEDKMLLGSMPESLPSSIHWGARGYNLLFTYISAMDGSNSRYSVKPKTYGGRAGEGGSRSDLSTKENTRLRLAARNRLRIQLVKDMDVSMEKAREAKSSNSNSFVNKERLLLPNGRVCDALLRSFSDDIEVGRAVWKRDLLPFARRMEELEPGAFLEITEKCFVALMFGCGRSSRPDIGMEIARAARKSVWSQEEVAKLSGAYDQGCRSARNQQDIAAFSLKRIFDRSMDESLRIELGLVDFDPKGPKIRIQFEDREK